MSKIAAKDVYEIVDVVRGDLLANRIPPEKSLMDWFTETVDPEMAMTLVALASSAVIKANMQRPGSHVVLLEPIAEQHFESLIGLLSWIDKEAEMQEGKHGAQAKAEA